MKCKILSDRATKLLSSISNIHVESARLPLVNLTSEDGSRSSVLSEENIVFKTYVVWNLKRCQLQEKEPGKYIESSCVRISSLDINYLRFRLYPKGKNSMSESVDFSVYFRHLPEKIYIECEIALIDHFRNIFSETFSGNADTLKENTINFHNLCPMAKIEYHKIKEKLTIQCNLKIFSRIYTCVSEKQTYTVKMTTDNKISNLNNDILKNGKYSDITLIVKHNQVKCHKFILATESPSLHILMKVNRRNDLELDKKENLSILRKLLTYMYTKKFRIFGFSDVVEFYIASYKYEVLNLKNLCTAYLIASLTEKNVSYVIDLSRNYEDEYLLNACIAFVKCHNVDIPAFMKQNKF